MEILALREGQIRQPYLQSIFARSQEILKSKTTVHLNYGQAYVNAPKFLYVKYEWTNKGHFWNEKARDFNAKFAYCEKRPVFDHFRLLTLA